MTVEDAKPLAPRKKGRPAGKRGTFSFRVTATLRAKLEASAAASERPVSEEIERRLERSFDDELDKLRSSLFGEPNTEALLRKIVWAARLVEAWNVKEKGNDPAAWSDTEIMRAAMRKAVQRIVVDATPHGPGRDHLQDLVDQKLDEPDPISEAQARGDVLGMVLTGNMEGLAVTNLGMGPQTEW